MRAKQDHYAHAEDAVLEVTLALTELQERQRDEQRDEHMNEETAEDVVGRAPEGPVVTLHDLLHLHPERCSICIEESDYSRTRREGACTHRSSLRSCPGRVAPGLPA